MTQISAQIIADSIASNNRLTTIKVVFPRMILAELNTHRMFSRNSASSRAIPFKKMLQMVECNPFIPVAWQKDHKGMQGVRYSDAIRWNRETWLDACNNAVYEAVRLNTRGGITKQLCNRLIEPFMWHTVLITATEWENFFHLRCPRYDFEGKGELMHRSWKDLQKVYGHTENNYLADWSIEEKLELSRSSAEIHMQLLAEAIWDAMKESKPNQLKAGEWHLPFGDIEENEISETLFEIYGTDDMIEERGGVTVENTRVKISVARCARLSYETLGNNPKIDYVKDIQLHDSLLENGHMSPFEHVARVMTKEESYAYVGMCGNFRGFIQYRKMIKGENKI